MKRGVKKLFYANKIKFITFLLFIIIFFISFIIFAISLLRLNGIENMLRILILLLVFIWFIFYLYKGYYYIKNRNKIKYIIVSIITIIISIILLILSYYINIVYGTIGFISKNNTNYYTGYLISLKDTDNIDNVGIIDNEEDIEGYIIANEIIKDEKLNYKLINYESYEDIIDDLYNKKIDGAFVQGNYQNYFSNEEEYANIKNETKIIYKKTISKTEQINTSNNKKLDKPFTILLMGVDSTDNTIASANSFNGDTLMLITFNPKTLNATMFSIPRDLYVPISCKKNVSAKINTSSVGGINCVMDTIKDLIDIDIDYYARINFKGVVDLVETLGGIYVNVTYPFCEQDSNRDFSKQICLKSGYQTLNGEEALAYARHRHTLPTGDLQRIQNQQLIVEAMAKKLLSLRTITDFEKILKVVRKNVATNLSEDEILSSYNILKQMMLNVLKDQEPIVVSKAYLEVYDRRIYNEKKNTYSAALGYYEKSLNTIIDALKVNLELKEPELIKEFSFDANEKYEQTLIGKGEKNEVDNRTIPNFVGKDLSVAEKWGSENNIAINTIMVDNTNSYYNPNVSVGLIGNQSIKSGTSLTNIKEITIYINIATESSDDNIDDNGENDNDNDKPLDDNLNDLFDIN